MNKNAVITILLIGLVIGTIMFFRDQIDILYMNFIFWLCKG